MVWQQYVKEITKQKSAIRSGRKNNIVLKASCAKDLTLWTIYGGGISIGPESWSSLFYLTVLLHFPKVSRLLGLGKSGPMCPFPAPISRLQMA
jgi:hypothetical protein